MAAIREHANEGHTSGAPSTVTVPFGKAARSLFPFAPTYRPLNHGSYGVAPTAMLEFRQRLLREYEARPDIFHRFTFPRLLRESRETVAPLLGASVDEVVFVANATTGVNVVLRNVLLGKPGTKSAEGGGDVVLCFSTVYPACLKTLWDIREEKDSVLDIRVLELEYPVEDGEVVELLRGAIVAAKSEGKCVRLAMFDTTTSLPGVRVPWEELVNVCRDEGVLSLVDAAHGIGHLDLSGTGRTSPDFLVSNCHK
jgi:hercynylcysteine S-oxide lyase